MDVCGKSLRPSDAVELAMSGEDISRSTDISRSRTERASRAERAQMLLAYHRRPT
jgi:hypothetical protein